MIPVFDITRQNKILKKELDETISSVIERGIFILGEKVAEFEREFANYIGVKYAIGVASGTDAISLALLAVGVGQGDEVIIPANAYPSVFAVTQIGAIPKLVDIDPATFNIDSAKISEAITKKTKAIMPVHIYGQPAEMGKIMEIGSKYKIPVVEDCAQAHGAELRMKNDKLRIQNKSHVIPTKRSAWRNLSRMRSSDKLRDPSTSLGMTDIVWQKVGSIGDTGCFSFYPTKNLGCFGDGGVVVTNSEEIYKKLKLLRMYGEESRYNSVLLGRNSRLDEIQAAILLIKLKYLDSWNERRNEIARLYKLCKSTSCKWPQEAPYVKHIYHLFVIRSKMRDKLKTYLAEKGIQTAIHYPIPVHLVPSMKYLGYKKGDFPESEKACNEILSLPMFPELKDEEIQKVIESVNKFH